MGAAYGGTDAAMRMILAYRQDEESSADQAAVTFLNATHQSARGLVETLEFMNAKLFGVQGINPYLQSHPLPPQRIAQLKNLAESSPYYNVKDPPELQLRHDLVKAKLYGFLDKPETVFNRFPASDRSLPAAYARAIATYRQSGVQVAMPQLDALIAANPNSPYFYEIKGQFLFESGNVAAAVPVLRKAVDLAPEEPLIRIMFAQALLGTSEREGPRRGDFQSEARARPRNDIVDRVPPARRRLCPQERDRARRGAATLYGPCRACSGRGLFL